MPTLADRVHAYFAGQPNGMTAAAARDLGVPEVDVVRHLPNNNSTELRVDALDDLMAACSAVNPVHVIVSNQATTLEATGALGNFSRWGEFFNVQTKGIDMHVRTNELGTAFAVRKPSHMDGVDTLSVQFYDREGRSAFKVFFTFGQKTPPPETVEVWHRIAREYAR